MLNSDQHDHWRERVVTWLSTSRAMLAMELAPGDVEMSLSGADDVSEMLVNILQRCNRLRSLSVRQTPGT